MALFGYWGSIIDANNNNWREEWLPESFNSSVNLLSVEQKSHSQAQAFIGKQNFEMLPGGRSRDLTLPDSCAVLRASSDKGVVVRPENKLFGFSRDIQSGAFANILDGEIDSQSCAGFLPSKLTIGDWI